MVVLQGGSRVTPTIETSNSWGAPGSKLSQASFSFSPPSTQTIVDRKIYVKSYLEVKVDAPFDLGTNDALRQFPLSSIIDVTTVQLNGETISDNTSDHLHAMLCYGNTAEDRNRHWSATTAQPDAYQNYADWQTYGSARNPLADYGENSTEQSRGGFKYELVDPQTIRVELMEPLLLSPLESGVSQHDEEGMVNINQINLNLRYKTDLSSVWSHSSLGNAITSYDVSFYQAPEVHLVYITPDLTQELPEVQTLHYTKLQDYIKPVNALPDSAITTVISDSIKLSMIPDRVYLYCRPSRSTYTADVSDAFLEILDVNILFNNQSGLLSTASEQQLYQMSVTNGLNMTYPQFSKYRGGVVCVEFGKDIGLEDNLAPGCQTQSTFQVQMRVRNVSGQTADWEFFTSFQMGGTFSVFENGSRASLGNLTSQDVLDAVLGAPELQHNMYRSLHGGSFWSSLKRIIHKASNIVQKVVPVASTIAGAVAPELLPAIGTVGQIARVAGSATRGGKLGGRLGGRLSGGSTRRLGRRRM
jgi:hypothetical protein